MRFRIERVASDAYLVDVFHQGRWVALNEYIPLTRRQVRDVRRFFNEGTDAR